MRLVWKPRTPNTYRAKSERGWYFLSRVKYPDGQPDDWAVSEVVDGREWLIGKWATVAEGQDKAQQWENRQNP